MGEETKLGSENGTPQHPYPVPPAMRTARSFPRVLAFLLTISWVIVFSYGTLALAKLERRTVNPFDSLFIQGTRFWGARTAGPTTPCYAYLQSHFEIGDPSSEINEEKAAKEDGTSALQDPDLSISGAFRVQILEKKPLAKIEGVADFNRYLKLEEFESSITLGSVRVFANSGFEDPEISLGLRAPMRESNFSVTQSSPTFLRKKTETMYSLRLPPEVEGVLAKAQSLPTSLGQLQELNETEFASCKNEVLAAETDYQGALINIGTFLSLAQINEDHEIIQALTSTASEQTDTLKNTENPEGMSAL